MEQAFGQLSVGIPVVVKENPFGRFTQTGGRHAAGFSFRVTDAGRTFHWDFIISTLAYSLARKGLSYCERGPRWYEEPNRADPPLLTCSCGDVMCGGFGDQRCMFTEESVRWEVEFLGETVGFVFDRVVYETWVVEALWRMRGGRHLRMDPWETLLDLSDFDAAVNALLSARPRCREMWRVLTERRRFSDDDRRSFASMCEAPAALPDVREFFGRSCQAG